jgi:isopenicillin N synthase-like dioxygenase
MACMRQLYRKHLIQLEHVFELPTDSLLKLDSPDVQHRLKLVKYFPASTEASADSQGVGAHQDETGWLTFVAEVDHPGLEVYMRNGTTWKKIAIEEESWGLNIGYLK